MIFGFDFQRDEVSFSFLLSHPTALSCITAADKLGIQYIASGRYARIETDAQGMSHLFAPESGAPDESGTLAALPPEVLSRLILPLGDFAPEDVAEMAEDFKL